MRLSDATIEDRIKLKALADRFPRTIIGGVPEIGEDTSIGYWTEIFGYGRGDLKIGAHCDIGSFNAINVSDSHLRCIGKSDDNEYLPITLEDYVYVGSHCFIGGGCHIGHHTVIAAGTIMVKKDVPSYSLVIGGPVNLIVKPGYYGRIPNQNR